MKPNFNLMMTKKDSCMSLGLVAALILSLSGCGKAGPGQGDTPNSSEPSRVPGMDRTGAMVKSRFSIDVQMGTSTGLVVKSSARGATRIISVTNPELSSMTMDTTGLVIPKVSNKLLDFGFLELTSLMDNQLNVCGVGAKQKCGSAFIRIYTTGTASSGLYNSADGYGVPLMVGLSSYSAVGLNPEGGAIMESIKIPSDKHVVRLSDFSNLKYNMKSDFTNAGAGQYSTTIVIEYALAP